MQDPPKAVWSIPYVSVAFFPSLKQNFIAYCSSEVFWCPDSIFEIHLLWQSGFTRVYSNCCCRCSFERKIIKIGQSSHRMYSNDRVNFQESTILNAHPKKVWKLIVCTSYIYIICVCVCVCGNWNLCFSYLFIFCRVGWDFRIHRLLLCSGVSNTTQMAQN